MADVYDTAVIGGGPAGAAAAIMLASEHKRVLLLERDEVLGGRIRHAALVDNTPFSTGISGALWASICAKQAQTFGVTILTKQNVVGIGGKIGGFKLYTSDDTLYRSLSVIVASGLTSRDTRYPQLVNAGCTYTACPAPMDDITGGRIAIIGGGNGAAQLALYYHRLGAKVVLFSTHALADTTSAYLIWRIENANIPVCIGKLLSVTADKSNTGMATLVIDTGTDLSTFDVEYIQVVTGAEPLNAWSSPPLDLDEVGRIRIQRDHSTNIPGIYAAGDTTDAGVGRFGTAIGDGQRAARSVLSWLQRSQACC